MKQQIDHIFNEIDIHSRLDHPFICGFKGFAQDSRYIYLVLELVNGGDLFSYLRSVKKLSTNQAKFYAALITLALEYIHSKDIIYRDLKPENLLI